MEPHPLPFEAHTHLVIPWPGPAGCSSVTGPRDQETKRTEGGESKKVWDREVLYRLHLMSGALLKHSMLHSVSRGELQQSQQNQSYNATESARAESSTMLHKGSKGHLKNFTE